MFNPTNLDEVCVQATHIEPKGRVFMISLQLNPTSQKKARKNGKVNMQL